MDPGLASGGFINCRRFGLRMGPPPGGVDLPRGVVRAVVKDEGQPGRNLGKKGDNLHRFLRSDAFGALSKH